MSSSKFFSKDFYRRIDWLVFNVNFSNISAIWWRMWWRRRVIKSNNCLIHNLNIRNTSMQHWELGYNRYSMIQWLLFNANSSIFRLHHGEFRFVLDQHAQLDFYSASSLKQQSAANQPLLFLLNAECLAEKQQIPIS